MGIYQQSLLPYLINLAMKSKEITHYRRQVIPRALGQVLEVGIGSGLNLPFYGKQVTQVLGLDPSPRLLEMAGRRRNTLPFSVELLEGTAEAIPLQAGSVDTVVSTWTLCSIPDVQHALAEIRRVLKPDGKFLFVEHGLAPQPGVQCWQYRLTPLWQGISGGCHLDRKLDDLIAGAGFQIETLVTEYAKGPKLAAFFYLGTASPGILPRQSSH